MRGAVAKPVGDRRCRRGEARRFGGALGLIDLGKRVDAVE
jgi:hypothetical protein